MKTTLDILDSVYREFKVKTVQNGEKMRNAVLAFIVAYNADEWHVPVSAPRRKGGQEYVKNVFCAFKMRSGTTIYGNDSYHIYNACCCGRNLARRV